MRDVKRVTVAAALTAAAAVLTGCGAVDGLRYPYAKKSADTIFVDATSATVGLTSVRVSGSITPGTGSGIRFNLLRTEDDRCGGTMSFAGADFDVVATDEVAYLKGSASSWATAPGLALVQGVSAQDLSGKWVAVGKDVAQPLCTLGEELLTPEERTAVDAGRVPDGLEVSNEGLSEAAGVRSVLLEVVDKRSTTDVWVSLDEPHHIVKMSASDKKGRLEVVFSDYDFPGEVRLPDDEDVLGPQKVTGRSG